MALELKPVFHKNVFIRCFLGLLAVHLTVQQIDGIFEFHRYKIPDTESAGMLQLKEWLGAGDRSNAVVMMGRYRFCINYFERTCYGFEIPYDDLLGQIKKEHVRYVVFTNIAWQSEEKIFGDVLRDKFKTAQFPFEQHTQKFGDLSVIDVGGMK